MERAYSHTRPPTFPSKKKPPPLSSTFLNNGGFFTTTSYDDVFGGPPKFTSSTLAPRAEEYTEIFGAFRSSSSSSSRSSSSIPVLDLPAVPDDIHSAAVLFDYSEIFGGFNAVDFAVPFDQLFRPCDSSFCDGDGDGDGDASSDEAWTPVGSESLSDDSDPFAFSENSQCFSSENFHQPSESKQFNVSYHKVNPGASTHMPNLTHVAQLNGVSGYTCVFDEATSVKEMGNEMCSPVVEDIVLGMVSPSDLSQKLTRKATSHASYDSTGLKSYNSDQRSGKACDGSISHINSASVSDINLRTEPSHLPQPSRQSPVLADSTGDFSESNSSPMASERCGLEANVDGSLPPFFDMEVDTNTSAAASAAAMKDAMEKAQVKLKAAKESWDRKDRVQNSGSLPLETEVNGEGNFQGAQDECLAGETRVHATSDRGPSKVINSAKTRHAKNASQNLPDNLVVEQPIGVSGKPVETKQGKKSSLSKDTDVAGEWKEARQYYEFVNSDTTRLAPQPPSSNGDAKTGTKQQDNDDHDSDSAREACVAGQSRRRLKATKAVSRQEYYEKMVKVAQEVHDSVICGQVEPDKKLKRRSQANPRPLKSELIYEPENNEISLCKAQKVEENPGEAIQNEAEKRSKNVLEKESEACHSEQVDRNAKGTHERSCKKESETCHSEQIDRNAEGTHERSCEMDEGNFKMQDPAARVGQGRKAEEICERQRTESRREEAPKSKKNNESRELAGKRSKEAFEDVLIGDRIKTSCDSEVKDNTKDLQQMKAADKRLKEAFEDVSVRGRLQRTCESHENNTRRNLQQRDGYKNHLEQAVDDQGSKKSLEKFVELEKCQKYNEAPEQVVRSQRLYEAHNLIVDHKNSEEGQKQNENIEKLEKTTELEHVGHKSLQACDLESTGKINVNTGDRKVQKGEYRSHIKIELVGEDQGPHSTPNVELPTEEKHLKSSNGTFLYKKDVELDMSCNLNKLQEKADGSKEVAAQKGNGEISTTPSDDKSKLEAEKTADVLIDERRVESTAAQVGPDDCELGGRTTQASDTLGLTDTNTKTGSVCTRNGQTLKEEKKKVAQFTSNPNLVKGLNVGGGKMNLLREGQVLFDHEEKARSTLADDLNLFDEHASKEEREVEVVHTVLSEGNDSFQNVGQSIERKGKIINHNCSLEGKDEDKERDLEEERLQKLEEERERLREREKDRMAVEIAVREARDRAYADARDRAERAALEKATDEARQRAMTEARERLEKACAEAMERSLADRASSEARLRAERAAVERANAEARQRAIEKAMAERATFGARERMQKSVSEKYTSERDVIMRQSSFPTNSERFEAANSEPAERCKARLERHRRTVERVAKALAEKNMRDLLAQREQTERTRFAETLDADIKRWSGGKEGNLRALLSTLQYILGPDSGWQPLPLTEVITAAAVKKAYRKATLCVHPDKLQQRGASIQQKYICEKVFDLLKEAWNRFNSEEK